MMRFRFCVLALCVLGVLLGGSLGSAHAEFLGDVCWTFAGSQLTSGTVRAGVYHIGGGHYLLSGVSSVSFPISFQTPINGNAEFIGGNIQLTMLVAGRPGGHATHVVYHVVLNPATLNGDYVGGATDMTDSSAEFGLTSGSVTHITCP